MKELPPRSGIAEGSAFVPGLWYGCVRSRQLSLDFMKILVVDDHSLIREALRGVLKDLEDDVVVLEAADCRQTIELAEQHADLDLILLDLTLPDRDGFSLLAELRERYPAVAVVVLSALDQRDNVLRALDLGALGFIPKNASRDVMLRALQLVLSGGIYIPPQVLLHEQRAPAPSMLIAAASRRPPRLRTSG